MTLYITKYVYVVVWLEMLKFCFVDLKIGMFMQYNNEHLVINSMHSLLQCKC